ncbi:MAG: hypothetical protein IIA85_02845 [Nanoarchaeota archaeon]|nr:hypothetical protein [Nanoarchaeota archaeon]
MNLSKKIKNLEKRGIISRKPPPIVPFILAFISLGFGIITFRLGIDKIWGHAFFYLAGFSFVFAIFHLIVVKIVEGKYKNKNFLI